MWKALVVGTFYAKIRALFLTSLKPEGATYVLTRITPP
jgi:hypothetical protein